MIISLYLARTMLGTTACAKIALVLYDSKERWFVVKCLICVAATPTTKNTINDESQYYDC